jgi:pimeloyl-ACP methyl ester carboxylesterase
VKRDIVIFPGHLCDARLFAHQIDALRDTANLQVADLYGHDDVAQLAATALAAAPRRFTLIANSMGGAVAFEALRQAPQRVQALVVIDTTCRPEYAAQSERRAQAVELVEQQDWTGLAQLYAPVFFHPGNRISDPGLQLTLEQMIIDAGRDAIQRQQRAFASRPDSRETLARISCATLVVCGRDDTITPLALSEEIASGIVGAQLSVIDHCGHVPTIECPAQTTAIIRSWLQQIDT